MLSGCVTPVQKPSFIDNSGEYNYRDQKDLKFRTSGDADNLQRPRVLYIAPPQWLHKKGLKKRQREELGIFLQEYFYQALLDKRYSGKMILLKNDSLAPYRDNGMRCARLESAITRINKGNGFMRYFVGFFTGQTDLQIEGRIIDDECGEEILAFAVRKRHAGNSYNGMNPRALSGMYCLRLSMEEAVLNSTTIIKDIWDSLERTGRCDALQIASFER